MAAQLPDLDRFSLQVTVYFKPEDVPKFFEHFKSIFEKVTAEPDCVYFEIFQDPEDPGKISWIENWDKSPAWMMEVYTILPTTRLQVLILTTGKHQISKEYYKPYFEATEPMFVKPREFKILKRVGSPYVMGKPQNFS